LRLWRAEIGAHVLLKELTAERITLALARIGKRTSAPTANPALGVLKTYLNWAANMGLLKDQSYRTVRPLKEPTGARHHRAWWTAAEVELALRCAAQDPHQPTATLLVACGCYLGLRVEEIIMLRWQDLSLDATDPKTGEPRPVCHITPNGGWQPKDGEARDIPISTPLLAVLKLHRQAEGYLLQAEKGRPGRPRGGKGWIYRYDPKTVWKRVMKLVIGAKGREITMYGMRHSFASNFLIAGVSDVKVARWLGHADTRMVHRHYGHLLSYDDDINAGIVPATGAPVTVAPSNK
jgi:integrase